LLADGIKLMVVARELSPIQYPGCGGV